MMYLLFFLGIFLGVCDSDILTNEEKTDLGVSGVVVNPKAQRLVLRCNYTGDSYKEDAKYLYIWKKDDRTLEANAKYRVTNEGSASILTVEGCGVEDAGNYSCILNQKEQATLRVYMYPTMEHVDRSKNQVQGDPLTLTCRVRGYPTPSLTWFKDEEELKGDDPRVEFHAVDGVQGARLIIKNLQYSDKGKYVCEASALAMTRRMEITVRVKDKYAALWPFLGICAEVAILCTIIFIFERRRTKPEFEDDDDKKDSPSHHK